MSSEVGIRAFKNGVSGFIDRVQSGEVITVTRRGKPVARVIPAGISPGMAKLIAEGQLRWTGRKLKLPRATPLEGEGPTAAEYVIQGRR